MQVSSTAQETGARLLRIEQVLERTGLGRTATYELIARGSHPGPIKVGRCSRWLDRELDNWIEGLAVRRSL